MAGKTSAVTTATDATARIPSSSHELVLCRRHDATQHAEHCSPDDPSQPLAAASTSLNLRHYLFPSLDEQNAPHGGRGTANGSPGLHCAAQSLRSVIFEH